MCMRAGHSAVRRALRRMFPMTQACSQVKCEKVKLFSCRASSKRSRVGGGRALSILVEGEGAGEDEDVEAGGKAQTCDNKSEGGSDIAR